MPLPPTPVFETKTLTAGSTYTYGYGGDNDNGHLIAKAVIDNQTAADVTIYVGTNRDETEATNGKRALQLATGKGYTREWKCSRIVLHNPHASTSAVIGVVIDFLADTNTEAASDYLEHSLTCDIDYITADCDRITADQTELR